MSEATIPIKELMEKTEQWLLGQGYKKSTLGFYRATWNRFLSYSASPAYSRETAEQFLLQYFGVDVHAIDQTLDGRMRHARRHMNALDEIFRTGTVCRRKVYGVASIDDDCFDKFFSDYLSYCKMQNFSRSWMDNHNKKSVKISLNLFALYAVMVCGVVFALPAFAASDPLVVVENLSTFIFSLIRAVGLILLGWGIVQVGLSLQSHDPSQRSQGFLTLAGGLVITFAKEILDLITA